MPPIPQDRMTEAQRRAVEELLSDSRRALAGPFVPLLRSPEFMSRLQRTGEYLRFQNALGPKLTEFVILLTARQWTQQYIHRTHIDLALRAGVKPEVAQAIREGRRPAEMAPDEQDAYDFCAELRLNQSVSDATYARAVNRFGERGVIDMTGLVAYYSTLAMIMNVARTPVPDGSTPLVLFPH
jgi:4-carboxymuconolactone decarboxylase